jgi:lipoprotein signal peptidase
VMVGFLAVAWGIFTGASWWTGLAVITSVVSLVAIVIPWWSVVPPFSAIGATAVDLAIIGFALLPTWHDALVAVAPS